MPNNPTGQADKPENDSAIKDAQAKGITASTAGLSEARALANPVTKVAEKSFNNPLFGAKK